MRRSTSGTRLTARHARFSLAAHPQAKHAVLRGLLVVGVLALALRAALGSLSFMLPGGDILGWSRLPVAHCQVCNPAIITHTPNHSLTMDDYAALLTQRLSLSDKLGQLLLVQFPGTAATPDAIQMIANQGAGGVLLYAENIQSASQIRSLTAQLQQMASIPLIIATDQEGGPVNRLISILGPLPAAASLTTPALAEQQGAQDAGNLHSFGFNLDLAPVVDVGTANPQLWGRTFGSNPQQVATLAGAYLAGLQQSGEITGTLKHFPGLGATTTDPHIGLPILSRSRADWENIDLAPYRILLQQQDVRAVLVTHELIPAVDPQLPASLSPALVTGVLRRELGFNGVVITDSLYMGALNSRWSLPEAAVLAVAAGADLLIGPYSPETVRETEDALQQALDQGILTKTQIDQAVQRDLKLKLQMRLIPMPQSTTQAAQASQNAYPSGSSGPSRPVQSAQLPLLAYKETYA
jgi:beta-N-acetylhexosaminidase